MQERVTESVVQRALCGATNNERVRKAASAVVKDVELRNCGIACRVDSRLGAACRLQNVQDKTLVVDCKELKASAMDSKLVTRCNCGAKITL